MTPTEIEVRFIGPDEHEEWLRSEQRSFGIEPTAERLAELAPVMTDQRLCAAFDGDEIVGTGGVFTTTMSLPGGARVQVGAITAIGTRATHTRRGISRRIMELLHEDSASRDEVATVLLASESLLYPRYGYGVATRGTWIKIDRRRATVRPDTQIPGDVTTFVDPAGAHDLIARIWADAGAQRPGWVDRPRPLLDFALADHEVERDGFMPWTLSVHHDADGIADGYCLHRHAPDWEMGQSSGRVFVAETVGTDPARLALWQHVLSIDLVESIESMPVPIDDALPDALVDRRQYRTIGCHDQLWIRTHDLPRLLESRSYDTVGSVVLDIAEVGRFRVDGHPDGATVTTTAEAADATMSRAEIGTLVVGNSVRPLITAGRVTADPTDVDRVDRLFRWPVAPFNHLDF